MPLEGLSSLKMLAELLGAAEHIASNVESHNTEIRANARQVDSIPVSHELAASKVALLQSVGALLKSNEVSISVSMGVAVPDPDASDESILQQADQAMYRSKHAGRNKVMAFEPEPQAQPA